MAYYEKDIIPEKQRQGDIGIYRARPMQAVSLTARAGRLAKRVATMCPDAFWVRVNVDVKSQKSN